MPYAFVPPGYSAVLVAQAPDIEDQGAFAPLEESTAEGTLVLLKLDFLEPVPEEKLAEIERACRDAGVEPWPGSEFYVYADTNTNSVYLIWQKGLAWLPIIIGIVGMTVLPPLLGTVLWWIIPDSLKNLISSLVNMGMMLLGELLCSKHCLFPPLVFRLHSFGYSLAVTPFIMGIIMAIIITIMIMGIMAENIPDVGSVVCVG